MKKTENRKFTLIELLIVVAIIALLAAMLMPAIRAVSAYAKRTKVRALANDVVVAIKQYEVTYGVLPCSSGDVVSSNKEVINSDQAYDDLIAILSQVTPDNSALPAGNKKRTVFLEVGIKYKDDGFVDPWGQRFKIGIDSNYDNKVKGLVSSDLNGKAFVYSKGPDKQDGTGDDIFSWK